MDPRKEIKKLTTKKKTAQKQGKLQEVAEYANSIGSLYCELAEYQSAIDEHETELEACVALNDLIGEAVANRRLGECYMEMGEFEQAKQYLEEYFRLSKQSKNLVEQQRSTLSMGRLFHEQAVMSASFSEISRLSGQAEKWLMKSLAIIETISTSGQTARSELNDMKVRTYMNLGLVASEQRNVTEAEQLLNKACNLARSSQLYSVLMMASASLVKVKCRLDKFTEGLSLLDQAFKISNKMTVERIVELSQLNAMVDVEMGNAGAGLSRIRKTIKSLVANDRAPLLKTAKRLSRICTEFSSSRGKNKLNAKSCELIADECCKIGAYKQAAKFYARALNFLEETSAPDAVVAPILASLAQTFADMKHYDEAITFYEQEVALQISSDNYEQAVRSTLNIAQMMELETEFDLRGIKLAYTRAMEHSVHCPPRIQMLALSNYIETLKLYKDNELKTYTAKLEQLKTKSGSSSNPLTEESQPLDTSSSEFVVSSDDERGGTEVVVQSHNKSFRIKRNEKGETQLHVAVIKGQLDTVRKLLVAGHPVNVRDNNGWLPVHEAANHDEYKILALLLSHGANVNDRGGEFCNGLTPLHDACTGGNVETIDILLEAGANCIAKDDVGWLPLDYLIEYRKSAVGDDLDHERNLDRIEGRIRSKMEELGMLPKTRSTTGKPANNALIGDSPPLSPVQCSTSPASPLPDPTSMYRDAVATVGVSAKRRRTTTLAKPSASTSREISKRKQPALIETSQTEDQRDRDEWLVDDDLPTTSKCRKTQSRRRKLSTPDLRRSPRVTTPSAQCPNGETTPTKYDTSSGAESRTRPRASVRRVVQETPEKPDSPSWISQRDRSKVREPLQTVHDSENAQVITPAIDNIERPATPVIDLCSQESAPLTPLSINDPSCRVTLPFGDPSSVSLTSRPDSLADSLTSPSRLDQPAMPTHADSQLTERPFNVPLSQDSAFSTQSDREAAPGNEPPPRNETPSTLEYVDSQTSDRSCLPIRLERTVVRGSRILSNETTRSGILEPSANLGPSSVDETEAEQPNTETVQASTEAEEPKTEPELDNVVKSSQTSEMKLDELVTSKPSHVLNTTSTPVRNTSINNILVSTNLNHSKQSTSLLNQSLNCLPGLDQSTYPNPYLNQSAVSQTAYQPIRVKIAVGKRKLVIPINGNQTIRELCEEIRLAYCVSDNENACNVRLTTEDGAEFRDEDLAYQVLRDNEQVVMQSPARM